MTSKGRTRRDVYGDVTAAIVEQLEAGTRPWAASWDKSGGGDISLPLRHNGVPYTGINVLMLWGAAREKGFLSPHWMTFKQAKLLGAGVRKGERSSEVVFMKRIGRTDTDSETGEETESFRLFARTYRVFNVDQIDGLPERYQQKPYEGSMPERLESCEAFADATGARIEHGGIRAFYRRNQDSIRMPDRKRFGDPVGYYGVLFHELTHWSGAPHRLDRTMGKRFGDDAYAFEELVAELGAAFTCASLGIETEPREDHASYIDHWVRVLKGDKRAIFTAASLAQKAVDYLSEFSASAEIDEAA